MKNNIILEPIGYISTNYDSRKGVPAQGMGQPDSIGRIEILEQFVEGIKSIKVGDELLVIFHFHQSKSYNLTIIPYQSDEYRGLFSTRSPDRPNGIGVSIVKVIDVDHEIITFSGADMISGSPVLDIKPIIGKYY